MRWGRLTDACCPTVELNPRHRRGQHQQHDQTLKAVQLVLLACSLHAHGVLGRSRRGVDNVIGVDEVVRAIACHPENKFGIQRGRSTRKSRSKGCSRPSRAWPSQRSKRRQRSQPREAPCKGSKRKLGAEVQTGCSSEMGPRQAQALA